MKAKIHALKEVALPVTITLGVQALVSMAATTVPVFTPVAAPDLGIEPTLETVVEPSELRTWKDRGLDWGKGYAAEMKAIEFILCELDGWEFDGPHWQMFKMIVAAENMQLELACGTCSVKVNGKPLLACELLVENAVKYFGTTVFFIEPLDVAPKVRDLVVDVEKAYERIDRAKPYIIQPAEPPKEGEPYPVMPKELEHYVSATRCINCFCCASACISSHRRFLGPNAMLAAIVRVMDPREQEKAARLDVLYGENGVSRCHSSQACTFVCPKEIDVAHFIALAKSGRFKPEKEE